MATVAPRRADTDAALAARLTARADACDERAETLEAAHADVSRHVLEYAPNREWRPLPKHSSRNGRTVVVGERKARAMLFVSNRERLGTAVAMLEEERAAGVPLPDDVVAFLDVCEEIARLRTYAREYRDAAQALSGNGWLCDDGDIDAARSLAESFPARGVAYVRVSTVQQGDSGAGMDAQAAMIADLAARNGLRVESQHRDVASGSTRKRRPGLAAALEELRTGDTLIVAKLDRLARSMWDFADIVREVDRKGGRLLIGDAPIQDMSSPAGRAFVQMLAVFADFERGMAQARTREAVAVKRAQGKSVGGRKPGCFLVPPETRARVRELRSRGLSLRRVAQELNEAGVPAGRGGRWYAESVRLVCAGN